MSTPDRRALIDRQDGGLSIRRQCRLLSLARSGIYRPTAPVNNNDLLVMRWLDELFTLWPFLGSRRMAIMLKEEGFAINRKRVQRLMRKMGIAALGPKPGTTKPEPGHKIFPYLLRNLAIARPNHVWAADITYIPIGARLSLSGGNHGLGVEGGAGVWAVQHDGCIVLRGGSRGGAGAFRQAGDLQHRPGQPVHQPGLHWLQLAFKSRWMGAAAGWTMSSSSGCGGRSSTRTSISRATAMAAKPKPGSLHGSTFTMRPARIRRTATRRRWRYGAKA